MGRSRSSLLPRESTPSGSEAPSWLPFLPSRRCGSPSRSSTRLAPASFTANASKHFQHIVGNPFSRVLLLSFIYFVKIHLLKPSSFHSCLFRFFIETLPP